jgi:Ca2+-binding EF-hand superfamily protein
MKAIQPIEDSSLRFCILVLVILPAGLAFFISGCATNKNLQPAAATPATGQGGFELADTNHDGKLSRAEANDFLVGEIFDAIDTDHDGRVTRTEWSAGHARSMAELKKRDANRDGVITRNEALDYGRTHGVANKAFREADKNHDGALDRAEVQAYYASREGTPR